MKPDSPRLFLIDGYALIYRAYFAMLSRPLITRDGLNTNAPWGVTRFLQALMRDHAPDYLGFVMDAGHSQRSVIYPDYKATREKMPDEMRASIPYVVEIVEALNIPVLRIEGYEADDVIGTVARQASDHGVHTVIVSGDKDFHQLVSPSTSLLNPGRGGPAGMEAEWVTMENADERLGVPPEQVTDYLALVGDSSDNVPGARGIGPKTAVKLLDMYPTLDQILAHASEVSGKRAREALEQYEAEVRVSKRLVTIMDDLPVELDLASLRTGEPDVDSLLEVFDRLEFEALKEPYVSQGPDYVQGSLFE